MITSIDMVTLYVSDQEAALQFYTEKLGFEKVMDNAMQPGVRWLTVAPRGDSRTQIILYDPRGWHKPEQAAEMMQLVGKHPGFVFGADDCRATVAAMEARGVQVTQQPAERPYGIEAVVKDLDGNMLVIVQGQ